VVVWSVVPKAGWLAVPLEEKTVACWVEHWAADSVVGLDRNWADSWEFPTEKESTLLSR
jgi:hypothetical protein